MAIKKYKPTSNGRRNMTSSDFAEITTDKPEKSLLTPLKRKGGRNNTGRTTVRHQGGGHKRQYRVIDFQRRKDGIPGRVATIEYDPNRSANIALNQLRRWRETLHPCSERFGSGHDSYVRSRSRHQSR